MAHKTGNGGIWQGNAAEWKKGVLAHQHTGPKHCRLIWLISHFNKLANLSFLSSKNLTAFLLVEDPFPRQYVLAPASSPCERLLAASDAGCRDCISICKSVRLFVYLFVRSFVRWLSVFLENDQIPQEPPK